LRSSNHRAGRILVVDDEEGVRSFLAETLERAGHDVTQVADGAAAIRTAHEEPFDVVLTDLRMPGTDGMTVVRTIRTEQPDVEVIVLTAFGDVATAVEAMKLGAFDYLQKPVSSPVAIRELVAGAIDRRAKVAPPNPSPPELATSVTLTFGAAAMTPVMDALAKVAKTGATVLLQGESGTGKEVAARLLHESSPRASKPFIAINCAVLTEELLESELFGHEKGSFTGAHAQRRGRIELADGGTFFLDEVGELSQPFRRSCSASWRSDDSNASVARPRSSSTFVGWRPRIETFVRWRTRGRSARISITASRCFRFGCRRSGRGARTSCRWRRLC
jgi:two-component system response regulator AtoC